MTTEKSKARIRIAPGTYRDRQGFNISGRDAHGRSIRIFTESRASAEHIRERVRAGLEIRVEDFRIMSAGQLAAAFEAGARWAHRQWTISAEAIGTAAHTYGAEHAPKPKRKKTTSSEAMSPGGAAWSEACRRGRTYDAMELDKIRERAANICSRQEGKPGPPPAGARYYLKYGPLANEAMVDLSKLGVPGHLITMQTREEWEVQQRTARYEQARESLKRHIPVLSQFLQLEQVDNVIVHGRTVARELLAAGERNEAADLARYVRCVERMVRQRWPESYKRSRPAREGAMAV